MYSEFSNIEYRDETFVFGVHDTLATESCEVSSPSEASELFTFFVIE